MRVKNEASIRLLAASLVDDDRVVLESLRAMRADIEELLAFVEVAERKAHEVPHRTQHLPLAHGLARRVLEAHQEWLDDVERELGGE